MGGTAGPTEYLQLARLVLRLSRHLRRTLDEVLQPEFDLTLKDHLVLRAIQEDIGGPGAIAALLQFPPPSVSRILERLRARGLISRSTHDADQRRVLLAVTPAGERLVVGVQELVAATLGATYAHVPASVIRTALIELATLDEVLAERA